MNKGEEAWAEHVEKQAKETEVRSLGKTLDKITISQFKVFIAPLKRKEDRVISKTKALLIAKLVKWEERGMLTVREEVALVEELVVVGSAVVTSAAVEEEEEDNENTCSNLDD